MPQVDELAAYWNQNPPLHLMVKAYMGIKSKSGPEGLATEDEIRDLVSQFGPGGMNR